MSMDDAVGVENMSVDQELLAASGASEEMVKLMPEYLVVCCWRSVKEVSLLLGQLTQDAPVQDPGSNDTMGLLTCQQVRSLSYSGKLYIVYIYILLWQFWPLCCWWLI